MEQFLATINSAKVRRATLNNREYLVAPLSLIVTGVLNGSKGALFYPSDEVSKDPSKWNHTPIVVNHPVSNGINISARDPDVLNKSGIGIVMKSHFSNNKLRAEGWFDVEATRRISPEIYNNLEAGRPIELSTGLFTTNEPAPQGASYRGKFYDYIARNYVPDHLAILPDQVGACSLMDGCGVNVNSSQLDSWYVTNQLETTVSNQETDVNAEGDVASFFMTLLHAATSAHLLHLQTRSFAQHMALDELYKALPDLVDSVIECYQGKNGLITEYPAGYAPTTESPQAFVSALISFVAQERSTVGSDSELQNLVDEIASQLDSTHYKLRFLA